jgi:hypothetical protein
MSLTPAGLGQACFLRPLDKLGKSGPQKQKGTPEPHSSSLEQKGRAGLGQLFTPRAVSCSFMR